MFCYQQERARSASLRLRGGTRPEGAARSGSPILPGTGQELLHSL